MTEGSGKDMAGRPPAGRDAGGRDSGGRESFCCDSCGWEAGSGAFISKVVGVGVVVRNDSNFVHRKRQDCLKRVVLPNATSIASRDLDSRSALSSFLNSRRQNNRRNRVLSKRHFVMQPESLVVEVECCGDLTDGAADVGNCCWTPHGGSDGDLAVDPL